MIILWELNLTSGEFLTYICLRYSINHIDFCFSASWISWPLAFLFQGTFDEAKGSPQLPVRYEMISLSIYWLAWLTPWPAKPLFLCAQIPPPGHDGAAEGERHHQRRQPRSRAQKQPPHVAPKIATAQTQGGLIAFPSAPYWIGCLQKHRRRAADK